MKKWHKHATGFQHWLRAWCVKWRWRWCMIKFISVRKCLVPIWLRHQNRLPFLVWSLIERRVWEITYVMSQKVVSSNSTTCWKSGSVLQMKLQRLWCIQWSRRNFIILQLNFLRTPWLFIEEFIFRPEDSCSTYNWNYYPCHAKPALAVYQEKNRVQDFGFNF